MNTRVNLGCAGGRIESPCTWFGSTRAYPRRAQTLVDIAVVVVIVLILLALLLPATRGSREAARRSSCINNVKQLTLALQLYRDTRNGFPLASTAPLVQANRIQEYGVVGTSLEEPEGPTNGTPGQEGDGYSWIAQCLPFMEENEIYEKMTATRGGPVVRQGKLADAAFALSSNRKLEATASEASPFFWSSKLSTLVCPSFPGEDDVASFGSIPKSRAATGNYVALAATHYRSSPSHHLESLPVAGEVANAGGHDCTNVPYCGNGGLPFPGIKDGRVPRAGLRVGDYRRGASKTALVAETREETLTSWYSGLASYVVAAMPPPNAGDPVGVEVAPGQFVWKCGDNAKCDTALNKGDSKLADSSKFYQPVSPHGGGPRVWGPSSRHPGVVIHGYGDGHTESIYENMDKDVYLQMVQRDAPAVAAQ